MSRKQVGGTPADARSTVVCVDDEPAFGRSFVAFLRRQGWEAEWYACLEHGLDACSSRLPDLVVLDWLLWPGPTGAQAIRELRDSFPMLPVVILTGRATQSDRVLAFEEGVDDCLHKSTSPDEVVAHLDAVIRRTPCPPPLDRQSSRWVHLGRLSIDRWLHHVFLDGERVFFTPNATRLLILLTAASGRLVSRAEMTHQVFDRRPADPSGSLRVLKYEINRQLTDVGINVVGKRGAYGVVVDKDK